MKLSDFPINSKVFLFRKVKMKNLNRKKGERKYVEVWAQYESTVRNHLSNKVISLKEDDIDSGWSLDFNSRAFILPETVLEAIKGNPTNAKIHLMVLLRDYPNAFDIEQIVKKCNYALERPWSNYVKNG